MKVLDPRYVPGRKHFFKNSAASVCGMQRETGGETHFSMTTDMWSSHNSEPYMSLTIQYIDEEWNLVNTCMQTDYFPEDHTGETIARGHTESLASRDLSEDRLVCAITDNRANVVQAISLNNWTRLQCFGHQLHLALGRSGRDKRLERAIGLCKRVVSAFSVSWKKKKKRDLSVAQEECSLPQHNLVTESPTKWGSRLKMLEWVLEQERAITQVL